MTSSAPAEATADPTSAARGTNPRTTAHGAEGAPVRLTPELIRAILTIRAAWYLVAGIVSLTAGALGEGPWWGLAGVAFTAGAAIGFLTRDAFGLPVAFLVDLGLLTVVRFVVGDATGASVFAILIPLAAALLLPLRRSLTILLGVSLVELLYPVTVAAGLLVGDRYLTQGAALPPVLFRLAFIVAGFFVCRSVALQLSEGHVRYEELFAIAPVPLWREDFSEAARELAGLTVSEPGELRERLLADDEMLVALVRTVRVTDVNPAALELLGVRDREAVIGRPLEVTSGSARRAWAEQFVALFEGRQAVDVDVDFVADDGRHIEMVLHWRMGTDTRGRPDPRSVTVAMVDMTAPRVVERSLRREADRLAALHDATVRISRDLDRDATLQAIVDAAAELLGADRSLLVLMHDDLELIGHGYPDEILADHDRQELMDGLTGIVLRTGRPIVTTRLADDPRNRGKARRRIEKDYPVDKAAMVVPIEIGERRIGTLTTVRAICDEPYDAQDLAMLEMLAAAAAVAIENARLYREAAELVRSKDRFVAAVSHELRTPLTGVLGLAEELRRGRHRFREAEVDEFIGLIADQAQAVAHMVEDLLVAARADIGLVRIQPEAVDVGTLAGEVVTELRHRFPMRVAIHGDKVHAWADPVRLRQILRNLLTNAGRYGGGQVDVEVEAVGDTVRITVSDDGDGVPEADRERIFEPYEVAAIVPTQPSSVGLGLSVARTLARIMDGDLVYEPGTPGSRFVVTVPRADIVSEAVAG